MLPQRAKRSWSLGLLTWNQLLLKQRTFWHKPLCSSILEWLLRRPSPPMPLTLPSAVFCNSWWVVFGNLLHFSAANFGHRSAGGAPFDRELLAIHLTIRHFRYYLEGRHFVVFTEHKPLAFAFHKTTDPWSPRQQRHLASISEYTTDVQHTSGKENFVADALSRSTINAVHSELAIDFAAMAAAQLDDADIATYKTCTTGLSLQPVPFGAAEVTLLCDVSTGRPRPLVPATFRRAVFDVVHNPSHPSIRSTKTLIAAKFVWPGLQRQVGFVGSHVRCLPTCQDSTSH